MEDEQLKIFDEDRNQIGVSSRKDVHRIGYWHEAFHCWFVSNEKGIDYIYLQLRSDIKKDYPNLLDITAAGHLLADETVRDGVREIKEEIGIDVPFDELVSFGVFDYCVIKENFIDKELANVFLYKSENTFDDFTLQVEEVSGIVKAEFNDFTKLWLGERETIEIKGFEINKDGNKTLIEEYVGRNKFVPHQISFYKAIIQKIKEHIKQIETS
ncbi:NUDIX hydrolase [Peribacillus loiseleuriae]|uniref:NUDIX hydrolase n=1 Tax=Peribacillus loiseleuriae TaxID=1679170 RepID=A0A0K9GV56_9BACI|nr:NUDIX domain-containing protein [Peribacillus loiseleuriae]KMY50147.1 NUDIX hydrolase [Peribacillus loiseleuriae]